MDLQKCSVCNVEFDLDTSGLEGPDNVIVCGNECAKKKAASRGNKFVIHDKKGDVVETDLEPGEVVEIDLESDDKPRRHTRIKRPL